MSFLPIDPEITLYYERIGGAADLPHLVFLHEGLGCAAMWKDFPQRLCAASGYPGLLYDRQGYGRSSPLTAARNIRYLNDYALHELPQVLAQLLLDQDYFVIGHSDGGSIGLLHAAERPQRLRGLITEAAHVFVEPETVRGIEEAEAAFRAGKLRGLEKYHGEKTEQIFRAWADIWLSAPYQSWNITNELASITCPLLVMQGVDDQYGTPAQVDAIVQNVAGAEAALIENCGHIPHLEQMEIVIARMLKFLN